MSKFNLLYSLFLIFVFLFLINNSIKSNEYQTNQLMPDKPEEGTEEEKSGLKEIDLNNDGKINYFEFQEIRQRRFNRLDDNNDNIITQKEFEKRNYKFFSEIDENNDRYLSKLEMFKERKKMRNILE